MYQGHVYLHFEDGFATYNNNSRGLCAVAQRVTYACTHVCYLGGFISALACGIFPRDERTMSVAKRKTRATLGRKYMGKPTGMRFRGETTRRKGVSKQESYE